jgi:hypothetical protein
MLEVIFVEGVKWSRSVLLGFSAIALLFALFLRAVLSIYGSKIKIGSLERVSMHE